VSDALDFVKSRHPDLHLEKDSILITVNRAVVPLDRPLKADDVVRFLPPIGGG
jgi:molybdopterin converting factor small subunit